MRSYSRVMNYSGHEKLRAEVAALTERLTRQTLFRTSALFMAAYNEIPELDVCFKD
ncbi:TPA: hypothetical protein G8M64_004824 [Salmonella enterica]|nr:hypothetical protein [Salmonella enterica]HAF1610462.1 hypothetical protein [Salmonella enterica]